MAEIVVGILGLAGVVFGGIITYIQSRRSGQLETIKLIIDNLQEDVARLRQERDQCSEKISELQDERFDLKKTLAVMQEQILDMRAGVQLLIQQLKQAGMEPEWKPGTGPLFSSESPQDDR